MALTARGIGLSHPGGLEEVDIRLFKYVPVSNGYSYIIVIGIRQVGINSSYLRSLSLKFNKDPS